VSQRICPSCKKELVNPDPRRKYHPECKTAKGRNTHRLKVKERGAILNKFIRPKPSRFFTFGGDVCDKFYFKIPWEECPSKNHLWLKGKRHMYMKKETHAYRDKWSRIISKRLKDENYTFYPGKIWIDIICLKPNHRGDAINLLDNIADMVKMAIDVDDRWFCIRNLDWEVVTEDPCVYVGIGQEHTEKHFLCEHCRRILVFSDSVSKRGICKYCNNQDLFEKELERLTTQYDNEKGEPI